MKAKRENNKEFEKYSEKNPFKVPDGYFDTFNENLEKRIIPIGGKESKIRHFWRSARNQLALAAGFIVFVAISYAVLHFILNGRTENELTGQQYAEILEAELEDIDTYSIIEVYSDIQEGELINEDSLMREEMIEYLANEDVDIDLIINEF